MSGINLRSVNKQILVGKVVSRVAAGKTAAGRDSVRFVLETEEYVLVKGESKVIPTRHNVLITNRVVAQAFAEHLKQGYFISLTGQTTHVDGKTIVEVRDYGGEASFMYVPADNTPAPQARPADKGGGFDMGKSMTGAPSNRQNGGDQFFENERPLDRKPPSKAPEGFDDDQIPF
jgi:single-stranded DNA-binding protein|nr:single-stranded DNA-binding protein [Neorhizobium tomejilense]